MSPNPIVRNEIALAPILVVRYLVVHNRVPPQEDIMKALYETKATATGGREGRAQSADGVLSVALSTPKQLGGAGGPGTNPEQLFAAGYSACFLSALKFIAGKAGTRVPNEATVTATVGIG